MITVSFTCKGCGIVDHSIQVPARESEDVVEWVRKVQTWIGEEHRKLAPNCQASFCDVKILVPPGTEFIGQQIE